MSGDSHPGVEYVSIRESLDSSLKEIQSQIDRRFQATLDQSLVDRQSVKEVVSRLDILAEEVAKLVGGIRSMQWITGVLGASILFGLGTMMWKVIDDSGEIRVVANRLTTLEISQSNQNGELTDLSKLTNTHQQMQKSFDEFRHDTENQNQETEAKISKIEIKLGSLETRLNDHESRDQQTYQKKHQ